MDHAFILVFDCRHAHDIISTLRVWTVVLKVDVGLKHTGEQQGTQWKQREF